jgi:cytochrome c biogenesis protein CcmG/thiol:disulfide interchange protein DsbE
VTSRPAFTHRPPKRGVVGPFSARQLLLAAGAVVVAIVVLVAITTPLGSTNTGPPPPGASQYIFASPTEGLRIGGIAPDLTVTDAAGNKAPLQDVNGNTIRLAALRGKAVWINFWASWCPPCQQETPILRELSDLYRHRGVVLIAIEVQETADVGRQYAQRYNLRYTIGADVTGSVFRAYRVYGLPTQFFIDPNGVIRAVVQGPLSREAAIANLEAIRPAPSASPTASGSAASPSP